MDPLTIGLITGGASLLGSIFSSETSADNTRANIQAQSAANAQTMAFNAAEAEKARAFNAAQAGLGREFQQFQNQNAMRFAGEESQRNRAFQQQMSSTAYQRARQDMMAAGLNPILAAGSPASTPSGNAAIGSAGGSAVASGPAASTGIPTMPRSETRSPFEGLGDAATKAVNSAVSMKTFEKMTEEIARTQAETALTKAREATEKEMPRLRKAEAETEEQRPAEVTARTQESRQRTLESGERTIGQSIENLRKELLMEGDRLTYQEKAAIRSMPGWMIDALAQGSYSGKKLDDMLAPLINSARGVGDFVGRFRGWGYR